MNEDQPHNDHRLHIETCPCGNLHPEVSGDDCDATVNCERCGRSTPWCYGTRGAIRNWNATRESLVPLVRVPATMTFEIVTTKDKAFAPYMVETMPTESWGSNSIWKTLDHAIQVATCLKEEYPSLPVRIKHYTGGPYEPVR